MALVSGKPGSKQGISSRGRTKDEGLLSQNRIGVDITGNIFKVRNLVVGTAIIGLVILAGFLLWLIESGLIDREIDFRVSKIQYGGIATQTIGPNDPRYRDYYYSEADCRRASQGVRMSILLYDFPRFNKTVLGNISSAMWEYEKACELHNWPEHESKMERVKRLVVTNQRLSGSRKLIGISYLPKSEESEANIFPKRDATPAQVKGLFLDGEFAIIFSYFYDEEQGEWLDNYAERAE